MSLVQITSLSLVFFLLTQRKTFFHYLNNTKHNINCDELFDKQVKVVKMLLGKSKWWKNHNDIYTH